MKLSRTFAIPAVRTVSLLAFLLSVWALCRTYPVRPPDAEYSGIFIYFRWDSAGKPEQLERRITSVAENWLSAMDGIASFSSVSSASDGKISVNLKQGTDPSSVISGFQYNFRLKRHELPKNFSGFEYNHHRSGNATFEFLLMDPDGTLSGSLFKFLSSIEEITKISIPQKRLELRTHVISGSLWHLLDSSRITPRPEPYRLNDYRIYNSDLESNYWRSQDLWISSPLLESTRQSFIPQTRINGIPAIRIELEYSGVSEKNLISLISKWPHYRHNIIITESLHGIRGFNTPYTAALLFGLSIVVIMQLLKRRIRMVRSLIPAITLPGAALLLWDNISGLPGDLPFMGWCVFVSLVMLFSKRAKQLSLKEKFILLIPVSALILIGKDGRFIMLLLPWLGMLIAGNEKENKRITELRKIPNNILVLFFMTSLVPIMLFVLPSEKTIPAIRSIKHLPSEPYKPAARPVSSELVAHLFLDDHIASFSGEFLDKLEKEILLLISPSSRMVIEIESARKITVTVRSNDNVLKEVRSWLSRLSLQTSGITWFINHDEFNYTNRSAPLLPAYRWTITGYNLDTLYRYGAIIEELLNSSPRVLHVRPFSLALIPDTKPPTFREKWRSAILPQLSSGKTYKFRDDENIHLAVNTSAYSRWRLYQENFSLGGMFLHGYDVLDSAIEKNKPVILKKNRNYTWSIGHEYRGTKTMSEEFYRSMHKKISGILPPGFAIENSRLKDELNKSKPDFQLLLTWLVLVFWPVIFNQSVQKAAVNSIRLSILLIITGFLLSRSESLPANWEDSIILAAEIWLLISATGFLPELFLLAGIGLIVHGSEASLMAGIVISGSAFLLTIQVSKWSAAESSLLQIWRDRQVYRTN